jgi:acyl-coenzyme A thioesterase PaaI-like protein
MEKRWMHRLALLAALAAGGTTANAHHSFPAQYDADKSVTLTGTVTDVQWTNPHIFIHIDVADEESGEVVNWALEMGGPNALLRLGWKRDSLKPGDVITVDGSLARDGSNLANAETIILADTGQRMLAGSSRDAETQ